MNERIKTASEEDILLALDTPAVFVNRFFIRLDGPIARLTMGEEAKLESGITQIRMRGSTSMKLADLLKLRDMIDALEERGTFKTIEIPNPDASAEA